MSSIREEKILQESVDLIIKELNPEKIILFGSRAKGESSKGSDFDIAVEVTDMPERKKIRMVKESLDEISGLYTIDLSLLNKLDNSFKNIILNTGKTLYERRITT